MATGPSISPIFTSALPLVRSINAGSLTRTKGFVTISMVWGCASLEPEPGLDHSFLNPARNW
jgi:hypothetical protein